LVALAAGVAACAGISGQTELSRAGSIEREQLRFPRVRTARQEKDAAVRSIVEKKGLAYPPKAILLRAFKKEGVLELWGAQSNAVPYVLLKSYGICATSGVLGPKRRFGDEQVPEGFYDLDWFNPQSNFFLSMHVNYPNAADRILGSHESGRRYFPAWKLRVDWMHSDNGRWNQRVLLVGGAGPRGWSETSADSDLSCADDGAGIPGIG